MNGFSKLLRGEPTKRTRFHTGRGVLMPRSAWLAMPSIMFQRVRAQPSDGPWMAPAAVARLDALIEPSWVVLEFGAGRSTTWYARRAARVTSVEDSPMWLQLVRQELVEKNLSNCQLELLDPDEYPAFADEFEDGSLDLVVVDSVERVTGDRLRCVAAAMRKVRPGQFLVLDDSDRPSYGGADRILSGWAVERFIGLKSFPFAATETSIYRRPLNREGWASR
jgi:hypothetical protein